MLIFVKLMPDYLTAIYVPPISISDMKNDWFWECRCIGFFSIVLVRFLIDLCLKL